MCMGKTHCLVGAAVGASWSEFVTHSDWQYTAVFAGFTGALALWPDVDHCGSSVARSLGFFSRMIAWFIGKITGGHRHATHSVPGILVTAGLALLAVQFLTYWEAKAFLAIIITFSVSGMLEDLGILDSHWADLAAIAVSAFVIWRGYGLAMIPLAVLIGCSAHTLADLLTDSGVMLAFPFSRQHFHLLPEPFAFTTNTRPEKIVMVLAAVALGLLAWHALPLPGVRGL